MHKYFLFLLLVLQSCAGNVYNSICELVFIEKKEYVLDDNTYYLSKAIFPFRDELTGKEYFSFENNEMNQHEIIIYDVNTCDIVERVDVKRNGPDAISMFGHYPESLDFLYITGQNKTIYKIDNTGKILQKYDYKISEENEPVSEVSSISFYYNPLILKDSLIYIPQTIFTNVMDGDKWSETPLVARLDMNKNTVKKLPLKYPRLFEKESLVTSFVNIGYSMTSNKDYFVYSFFKEDSIIVTKDHISSEKYAAKSRYVKNIKSIPDLGGDMIVGEKKLAEQGMYWHFVYDKYRELYYRFVLFPCEVSKNDNIMEVDIIRQEFSVIIMNKDFEILGETKFPKDKYLPKMFFVGEKGLYISENNPKNPEFDENKLVFSCFVPEYL